MMYVCLVEVGEQVGIKFKFGGCIGVICDFYCVIYFVGELGGEVFEIKIVEGLFVVYFENEEDIIDLNMFKVIVIEVGILEVEF